MTHLKRSDKHPGIPTAILTLPHQTPPPRLDRKALRGGIALRRRQLLNLETAMIAACEASAARGHAPRVQIHDRETWDRATWTRYLAAAARLEADYGPPMRQIVREIAQLERVLALPVATETPR
jgi:hypothetical protein